MYVITNEAWNGHMGDKDKEETTSWRYWNHPGLIWMDSRVLGSSCTHEAATSLQPPTHACMMAVERSNALVSSLTEAGPKFEMMRVCE